MTRKLHEFENLQRTDRSVEEVLLDEREGEALLVAPDDDRLDPYLGEAVGGQSRLFETKSLPDDAFTYHVGNLTSTVDERMPYDDASFDTVVTLWSKEGGTDRMSPFLDLTRVVKPGGKMLCAHGLLPNLEPYHDFKSWTPKSKKRLELETIYLSRTSDYQTPNEVAVFSRKQPADTDIQQFA